MINESLVSSSLPHESCLWRAVVHRVTLMARGSPHLHIDDVILGYCTLWSRISLSCLIRAHLAVITGKQQPMRSSETLTPSDSPMTSSDTLTLSNNGHHPMIRSQTLFRSCAKLFSVVPFSPGLQLGHQSW